MYQLYKNVMSMNYVKTGIDVDYQIVLDKDKKTLFVYFQGSTTNTDWNTNFDFPSKAYRQQQSCLRAHRGYIKAYKSANDEIFNAMKQASVDALIPIIELNVSFIGHSYGGAMAILAAEDFYFRFQKKPNLVTFGAPRVLANKKSVDYLKECCDEIFQFGHKSDFVTYMPPMYKHVKLRKLGTFDFIGMFTKLESYHLSYGQKELYEN